MKAMTNFTIPEHISCLLTFDPESGNWVSHCLDFDLVTSGETEDQAWQNIKSVVARHIEHCFTWDQLGLQRHRASKEAFDLFKRLEAKEQFRSDRIKLNLVARPQSAEPELLSFWIRGIEDERFNAPANQAAPAIPALQ